MNKKNATSTSVSQPNRRAECENVRDLFFLKQWDWGRASSSHQHSSGTSLHCLLQSLPPGTVTFPAARSGPAGEGQQPSLGIPRCNTLHTGFCLPCALDVQATNQKFKISQSMTIIQHGKPHRKHNNPTSAKESWRCKSPLTSLQSIRVLLQVQVKPTCLKTTNTLGNAQSGPGWPKRGTEVPCTTQEH